ncbi:MAG: OmpH family outer membrane protein [Bacteroidales bacterium]|nr:OmpH family outer membrane protein [Bacteroidales bacterium]MDP2236255.1 OmpH family outer membrane protein [Bacteroidales bacterium]
MKTLTRTFLLLALIVFAGSVQAQSLKIGHIDSNEIMNMMPERTVIENNLKDFEKQLEAELRLMMGEYQTKVADYQNNVATMSNLIRQSKEKEITDLQTRIQDFQQNADVEFGEKRVELLTPLIDKVKKAIEDVGKENNYTYIIDAATGVLLHVGANADDVTKLVKTKLNLK